MSDIFQEVEEEVRRERFEKLWKQYGDYIIAGVALIIIGIAGWQLWSRYEANERLKASEQLMAAQSAADGADYKGASSALGDIVKNAPGGYAEMARLSEAGTLLASGQHDQAIELYRQIAASDKGPIGTVATLRAAWAMAGNVSRSDVETLLAPLSAANSPWRHAAREVLAYCDYHDNQIMKAEIEFQTLANDKDAPDALRRRASAMADFLKQGGATHFGTVPQPTPAAPPAGPVSGTIVKSPGAAPPAPPPPPAPAGAPAK